MNSTTAIRYCNTCEQHVSEPCNSVDCSTPEVEQWPAVADDFECCGCPTVGAQYMGQAEMVCCGNPLAARSAEK